MRTCTDSAAISRAWTYKLLAECYYPPTAGALSRVRGLCRRLVGAIGMPGSDVAGRLDAALAAEAGSESPSLSIDHARLFVGPFGLLAPPYGSVYLENENRLMGDSSLAAAACYREAGLELAPDFNEAPDHITVELEFMHYLAATEHEALSEGNRERAERLGRLQAAFLERHLAAWVPGFAGAVAEHAQSAFYREVAEATRAWIDQDTERFQEASAAVGLEAPFKPQGALAAAGSDEAASEMTSMRRNHEQILGG